MLISFEKLIRKCIHKGRKKEFHTRLDINRLREMFTQIHEKLKEANSKSLEQITDHKSGGKKVFKPLSNKKKIKRLADYFSHLDNGQEIEKVILNSSIWQLRVNKEMRIIGFLEKDYIDEEHLPDDKKFHKDLFCVLYYDFHHTSFPRSNKGKPKEEDLTCLMDEECPLYNFLTSEK